MIHPDIYVKSNHKGLGVFAGRDFKRGEILWIIDENDLRLTFDHYNSSKKEDQDKLNVHAYMDSEYNVILAWDAGKYVNHDCEPNSTSLIQFDNISIALRDIQKDEEIVEDYASYFAHFETFNCQCQSERCRGKVLSGQDLHEDLRLDLAEIAPVIRSLDQHLLTIDNEESRKFLILLDTFK